MKQVFAILVFSLFALHIRAQQMISVIDHDTRKPVWRAYFTQDGDTIAYTSPEGIALVPKHPGKVKIIARDYKPIEVNADSIPAIVHLKSEVKSLDEIVVLGDASKINERMKEWFGNRKGGYGGGGGGDLGRIFRIFGYKPASEIRRNRVKKNLEAFDKAAPTPPAKTK